MIFLHAYGTLVEFCRVCTDCDCVETLGRVWSIARAVTHPCGDHAPSCFFFLSLSTKRYTSLDTGEISLFCSLLSNSLSEFEKRLLSVPGNLLMITRSKSKPWKLCKNFRDVHGKMITWPRKKKERKKKKKRKKKRRKKRQRKERKESSKATKRWTDSQPPPPCPPHLLPAPLAMSYRVVLVLQFLSKWRQ